MPLPTIPSADLPLKAALLAQSALTNTAVGTDIRLSRPTTWPNKPIIVLTVIDEIELRPEANSCRVQADLFGANTDASSAAALKPIASVLQSVSRDCDGVWAGDWGTAHINNCRAPTRLPSPETTGRARIIVDFEFEVTP